MREMPYPSCHSSCSCQFMSPNACHVFFTLAHSGSSWHYIWDFCKNSRLNAASYAYFPASFLDLGYMTGVVHWAAFLPFSSDCLSIVPFEFVHQKYPYLVILGATCQDKIQDDSVQRPFIEYPTNHLFSNTLRFSHLFSNTLRFSVCIYCWYNNAHTQTMCPWFLHPNNFSASFQWNVFLTSTKPHCLMKTVIFADFQ